MEGRASPWARDLRDAHRYLYAGGTFLAAADRLHELIDLGINVLEVMPVAEFDGSFGWGYDGVALFAPYHHYGTPDDFRSFVDRAHALGMGVILDVVYNHFGPSGCYHRQYADDYSTDRYECEWGDPMNFDGENAGPVREFFLANAAYWIEEFHVDGLRMDATQQMFDASEPHIVSEVAQVVRKAAAGRLTSSAKTSRSRAGWLVRWSRVDSGWMPCGTTTPTTAHWWH